MVHPAGDLTHILAEAADLLQKNSIENSDFEAKLLLAHVLGISREQLLLLSNNLHLTKDQNKQFETLTARRANREPMSHLLGTREFYGREFKVTKDVLDPRPDTEILIDTVLNTFPITKNQQPTTILDIGTGSGCIILTLLAEIKNASGVAMDISPQALAIAKENAMNLNLIDRVSFIEADMFQLPQNLFTQLKMSDSFASSDGKTAGGFDIIVSNPPYITTEEIQTLMPEVRDFEPYIALNGGKDGLDTYRILAKTTASLLKPDGLIFLEIGETQAADVVALFSAAGWMHQKTMKDLAGRDRCIIFKHNNSNK